MDEADWRRPAAHAPLCEFLEIEVPDEPLPSVNGTPMFVAGIMGAAVDSLQAWWEKERPPEP